MMIVNLLRERECIIVMYVGPISQGGEQHDGGGASCGIKQQVRALTAVEIVFGTRSSGDGGGVGGGVGECPREAVS